MAHWQRRARIVLALFVVGFLLVIVQAFKHRAAPPARGAVSQTDPTALVESSGGHVHRLKGSREDVSVAYEQMLTYGDGTSKMLGVTVVVDNRGGGRSFKVTGKDAQIGRDDSVIALNGDIRLAVSDGLTARTEHATYAEADGTVRASGPVEFSRQRMTGSGVGLTYDKNRDVMWILDQAVIHVAADAQGAGATEIVAGAAGFARRDKYIRFERGVRLQRGGQTVESDEAVAYLSDDDERMERMELRGRSSITETKAAAGALQGLSGRDINLKYAPDGQTLEHALIVGNAVVRVAGERGKAGRQITAASIDVALGPDGSTPTMLAGREGVELRFPAEQNAPASTIKATNLDASGEPGRGLTKALFEGRVQYREQGPKVDRTATSATLEVALKPGMSAINEAKFGRTVRFDEGGLSATAASAHYLVEQGIVELTGTEPPPGAATPRVVNEQIDVRATRIDLTLAGPKMTATGAVKSALQPAKANAGDGKAAATKLPSMLKQDQPVTVTANALQYDGDSSTAAYDGNANLWQADTTIKAASLSIDDKKGDLSAKGGSGMVTTTTVLEEAEKDKPKRRSTSTATSKEFAYEDAERRATYTGDAHMNGSQGDITATKIELYLKPSGDELDRAEAYEKVMLREQGRKTTGARMTYTVADERYRITGRPVTILDECGRETIGTTLIFLRATDTINIDGGNHRAQTKGGQCQ